MSPSFLPIPECHAPQGSSTFAIRVFWAVAGRRSGGLHVSGKIRPQSGRPIVIARNGSGAAVAVGPRFLNCSTFGKPGAARVAAKTAPVTDHVSRNVVAGFNFVFSGLSRALQASKQSARRFANRLHLSLSAGLPGLVALCDGHTVERKEMTCPTRDGSNMTRNGA